MIRAKGVRSGLPRFAVQATGKVERHFAGRARIQSRDDPIQGRARCADRSRPQQRVDNPPRAGQVGFEDCQRSGGTGDLHRQAGLLGDVEVNGRIPLQLRGVGPEK